jgi:hypothetical protein
MVQNKAVCVTYRTFLETLRVAYPVKISVLYGTGKYITV